MRDQTLATAVRIALPLLIRDLDDALIRGANAIEGARGSSLPAALVDASHAVGKAEGEIVARRSSLAVLAGAMGITGADWEIQLRNRVRVTKGASL